MSTIASMLVSMGLDGSGFKSGAADVGKGLETMQDEVAQTSDMFEGLGSTLATSAKVAGVAAGAALAAGVMSAMDTEVTIDRLAAQLDLLPEESARIGDVAGSLFAKAYGTNMEDVATSVGAVRSSIAGMATASSADLEKMTARAMDFSKTFEIDVARGAATAGTVLRSGLAKDATEAFDLITAASSRVPAHLREDVLDAADEYGQFFNTLGFSGSQAFGLLVGASAKGTYGIDKMGDSLKEFTLLSTDLGSSSVTDAYEAIGLSATDMSNAILSGGPAAQEAFQQIVGGLAGIKDPSEQAAAAIGLFGTPLEDLNKAEIPEFLASLANVGGGLDNVAGATDRMGQTLNDNASTNLTSFWRQMQTAFVDIVGGKVLPIITSVATFLASNFGPALQTASGIVTNDVIPAVTNLAHWIGENQTPILVVAGLIAAIFLPHLISLGVTSTLTAAKAVAAWVLMKVEAITSAAVHSAQIVMMIGRWIAMGAAAVLHAAIVVGSWALVGAINFVAAIASFVIFVAQQVATGASAVASAAMTAAAWVATQARTVAALVVMAAGFVAQGAVMLGSVVLTVAGVVAGWVMMGVQSLLQAARMAAAWLIAMGPVGWVIAAVIALVALIVANWDTIVAWTTAAWDKVWEFIKSAAEFIWNLFLNWSLPGLIIKHWDTIVAGVRAAINWVMNIIGEIGQLPGRFAAWFGSMYDGAVGKLNELLGWLRGLPGQILDRIGDLGQLLVSAGKNVIDGLWSGIQSAAGWVKDKIMGLIRDIIPGPVRSALGINSPSKVMAEIGRWVPLGLADGIDSTATAAEQAAENLADRVSYAMAGIVTPDLELAIPSPRMPTAGPNGWGSTGTDGGDGGGRSLVHIENYHPPADASASDVAEDLDWFSRGRG